MKIVIVASPHGHQAQHAAAFAAGLRRHGIVAAQRRTETFDCDLAVFWGHRQAGIIARQRSLGRRYLVMERGYIGDRFAWTSLGYDGLNGRADFCLPELVDRIRFERHHSHLMRSWGDGGHYALLLGQVASDAALARVDIAAWYRRAVREIQAETGLDVRFRPHPLARGAHVVPGAATMAGSLEEALAGAALAVTWNSNSGVDAVLAGVPTVAMDQGTMAWPVASHEIAPAAPAHRPDRADWAARLAWCQWTMSEIESGEAWAHLKIGMDRVAARDAAE